MPQSLPTIRTSTAVQDRRTPEGVSFQTMGCLSVGAPPLLIVFASSGRFTLETSPYRKIGEIMRARGWNVISLDLPCEGANRRSGEHDSLLGWAERTKTGENIVVDLQSRTSEVVQYLIESGEADPQCIAVAGTSRGAFMAFHAAAFIKHIRAVIGFAPVTDISILSEFEDQSQDPLVRSLALEIIAPILARRALWITIGHNDERVGTDKTINLIAKIQAAASAAKQVLPLSFHILPVPGHTSFTSWHEDAGRWLHETLRAYSTILLPRPEVDDAVPCIVYPPIKQSPTKAGLVIHLYGSGGSLTDYNLMHAPYDRLRLRLLEAGYMLLVPELGPSHWMNELSIKRLDAIIAELVSAGEVDPERVHIIGSSMGGGSALIFAARSSTRLRSICAVFPMTNFEAWIAEQPKWSEVIHTAHGSPESSNLLGELSPINQIASFRELPLYILHGSADPTVPVQQSRAFVNALREVNSPVTYREVPAAHHDDDIASDFQDEIADFILQA